MIETFHDWASLVLRWLHVVAGIAWIGHAFMFNWIDASFVPPESEEDRKKHVGDLWFVHGGGFYHLRKTKVYPTDMRGPLHWFKWEAGSTWLTGFLLLVVVYYLGGGVLMVDRSVMDLEPWLAVALGLGSLVLSWLVYDVLWQSPIKERPLFGGLLSFALLFGLAAGLSQVLSGRAAYIHVGAVLGTLMAGNVWMRIIPPMRRMVEAAKGSGEPLDPVLGTNAKRRSKHNNYMVMPLLFVMISNHYTSTYAHHWNWVVLVSIVLVTAGSRHFLNKRMEGRFEAWTLPVVGLGILGFVALTSEGIWAAQKVDPDASNVGSAYDPGSVGRIVGRVRFEGALPAVERLALYGGCEESGTVALDDRAVVSVGGLENVFVRLTDGTERWTPPPVPAQAVEIDQRGCMYAPHVAGARVGQTVAFLNSDDLFHNVRSVAKENPTFNDRMPTKDLRIEKVFLRPEVMLQARCDVHPWMAAYVGIVDHPWFAVSGPAGSFEIPSVPEGDYALETWHEVYGSQSVRVTVAATGTAEVEVVYPRE